MYFLLLLDLFDNLLEECFDGVVLVVDKRIQDFVRHTRFGGDNIAVGHGGRQEAGVPFSK